MLRSPLTFPQLAAATIAWSIGGALLLGHAYAVVADLAPARHRARYLAAYGTSWGLASIVAPVVGTRLIADGGPRLLWSACAATALALAVLQPRIAPGPGKREAERSELAETGER